MHLRLMFNQTRIAIICASIGLTPAASIANQYSPCDYNGKSMGCTREWSNGSMRIRWKDGVSDTLRLLQRTTSTTAIWRDSRGGRWNSLDYAGGTVLTNPANRNTIIINGTRSRCLSEWRLGEICNGGTN